jgi:gluconate 5-dehydrogenase
MTRSRTSGLERFSLSGRIALVTGATRGLGLEIACGMAAAGAVVGINGRDAERAREIARSRRSRPRTSAA